MENQLINDPRLTPTMERIRDGRTQLFREKDSNNRSFISAENCDLELVHEKKSMYAELIDGQWYWVEGCAECKGEERDWMTYVECDEHNVCRSCGTKKKDIKETPWGGKKGWICQPCYREDKKQAKKEALREFRRKKLKDYDFVNMDSIRCPYCNSEHSNEEIHQTQNLTCNVCDKEFEVEVEYIPNYSTSRL